DADLIAAFLRGPLAHGAQPYMPRIALPEPEVLAIAAYLAAVNNGQDVQKLIAEQRAAAARVAQAKE
ncbi:MAG: cytochrome c, partial [Burkholderiaceae bacterium]|nr:cytochrome c [Burkholderiaceae bacterium]